MSFDAEGNIYPCEGFVGISDYCMGNIYHKIDRDIQEKFMSANVTNQDKCQHCWARYLCGGDCYHNAYLVNHSIFTPDDNICYFIRNIAERALILYYTIKESGDLAMLKNFLAIRERIAY
jgi:uncharacterized protein